LFFWLTEHIEELAMGLIVSVMLTALIMLLATRKINVQLAESQTREQQLSAALNYECEKAATLSQELNAAQSQHQDLSVALSDAKSVAAGLKGQLQQVDSLQHQLKERDAQLATLRDGLSASKARMAEISARAETETRHHAEQVTMLKENKEQLKEEFVNLANEIFDQKNKKFNEQSKESMSLMLDPFQKQIDQFRKRVDDIHTQDTEGRSQLVAQLSMLKDMNSQLNKQADDLTKALKGDKKLQGNWGELQVERILESSGLQKGREYEREPNYKDDDGQNRRPDFIIHLPDGKHIIIDSKVSLNAYQKAVSAEEDSTRDIALREHVAATRTHIRSLSSKNYPGLTGINAPDFVLMFMPIESAFVAAFEAEPNLFNEAFERHIVVVTPTTLLATLRTVANIWVLERQNENAKELFSLAGKIYDKLSVFGSKMDKLGAQIDTAGKTWHEAISSMRDGRGSMVSYVKRLKELGAPTSKKLSESLATRDLVDELEEKDSEETS